MSDKKPVRKKNMPKKQLSAKDKEEQKRIKKLKNLVEKVPTTPGIYQFFDEKGEIIYIGNAKSLRKRVQSYFRVQKDASPKLIVLVKKIQDITYVSVDTETEALILEMNLIKQYRPRYNVLLKDDKSYVYLKFSMSEDFPRIDLVRHIGKNKKDVYLGPYTTASPIRDIVIQLNKLFTFRTCRGEIQVLKDLGGAEGNENNPLYKVKNINIPRVPCLQYHIKRCEAPCLGLVNREEYHAMIKQIIAFFKGDTGAMAEDLQKQMMVYSENREFEKAASARDKVKVLESLTRKQTVVSPTQDNFDVLGIALYEKKAFVVVFQIRNGKLITSQKVSFGVTNITTEVDALELFIKDYYEKTTSIPKEICLPYMPDFQEALEERLTDISGSSVHLSQPQRGFKSNLLSLAMKNVDLEATNSATVIGKRDGQKAVKELAEMLKIKKISLIECYDISHIQGTSKVGSMVVFRNGVPDKSLYKRFKIKTLEEGVNDDFASLTEVVMRRMEYIREDLLMKEEEKKMIAEEKKKQAELKKIQVKGKKTKKIAKVKKKSEKKQNTFEFIPDLIILDGGKGQLSAVYSHMKLIGIDGKLPIIALAKKQEEIFVPGAKESIQLPDNNSARLLIQRIRDEAHRFAITYHRAVRSKKMVTSVLDDIKGIGAATKKKLMKEFGTIQGIREASDEELRKHVSEKVLQTLHEML